LFAGDSLPCVLAGVLSVLVGSLALRFVIVRLPHAFS